MDQLHLAFQALVPDADFIRSDSLDQVLRDAEIETPLVHLVRMCNTRPELATWLSHTGEWSFQAVYQPGEICRKEERLWQGRRVMDDFTVDMFHNDELLGAPSGSNPYINFIVSDSAFGRELMGCLLGKTIVLIACGSQTVQKETFWASITIHESRAIRGQQWFSVTVGYHDADEGYDHFQATLPLQDLWLGPSAGFSSFWQWWLDVWNSASPCAPNMVRWEHNHQKLSLYESSVHRAVRQRMKTPTQKAPEILNGVYPLCFLPLDRRCRWALDREDVLRWHEEEEEMEMQYQEWCQSHYADEMLC